MGGGSPTYNYPEQPSYGEGMADALKAQVELLTGTGDFAEIAPDGLEGLLPLEENIRKKTAQTDTDVLRQTLLGSKTKATRRTYDDQGRLVVGVTPGSKGQETQPKYQFRREYDGSTKDTIFSLVDPQTGEKVAEQVVTKPISPSKKTRQPSYYLERATNLYLLMILKIIFLNLNLIK